MTEHSPQIGTSGCLWACIGVCCISLGILAASRLALSPIAGAVAGFGTFAGVFVAYLVLLFILERLGMIQ